MLAACVLTAVLFHAVAQKDLSVQVQAKGEVNLFQGKKDLKVVVNSCVNYKDKTWPVLQKSMEDAGWTDWDKVILVLGGSTEDRVWKNVTQGGRGNIVIETKFQNFDLHGLSALWHHKDDPLIHASAYLYLPDTSTVGPEFTKKMVEQGSTGKFEVRRSERPSSNIAVFGDGVVERFGQNFDTSLSKADGALYEFGQWDGTPKLIDAFADTVTMMTGREAGKYEDPRMYKDLYMTGVPRMGFYYPDLDVTKWILLDMVGDLTGNPHRYGHIEKKSNGKIRFIPETVLMQDERVEPLDVSKRMIRKHASADA
eukprot:TRINITY_DN71175_c0_g1_i1.p1 TRINITY_DN71175_c0_g1~~TRINITY_DN71175_c0_g1_i1.p1  ORF type:complete len:311 (-),score=51.73 TRINITY_DN71175_c0_g1_i1:37-969(-)